MKEELIKILDNHYIEWKGTNKKLAKEILALFSDNAAQATEVKYTKRQVIDAISMARKSAHWENGRYLGQEYSVEAIFDNLKQ